MNIFKRTAAFLSAAIILSVPLSVNAELYPEQKDCPDLQQIRSEKFSSSQIKGTISKLSAVARSGDTSKMQYVSELLSELITQFDHMQTLLNMYELNFDLDVSNDELSDEYSKMNDEVSSIRTDISDCMQELYDGGFEDALKDANGYNLVDLFIIDEEFRESSNELRDKYELLSNQENELILEYSRHTDDTFYVEYEGERYTWTSLINNLTIGSDKLLEIEKLLYEKQNKTLGEIFLKLVKIRQQIAELYGYDNYTEYVYDYEYIRDYTSEDTDNIYSVVKKDFSELYSSMNDIISYDIIDSGLYDEKFDSKRVTELLAPFFMQAGGDIGENFSHITQHHLYDIEQSSSKLGHSYMNSIYDYNVPYIFINPNGTYEDLDSFLHEFGHANENYENPSLALYDIVGFSIDTSEMHSQGMQILFTESAEEILGEDEGKAFNERAIYNMIDSIVTGCLYDEFQKYAYKNPDCTLDDLNQKFEQLAKEYGLYSSEEYVYINDWTYNSHNFTSPLYYITYATSAVPVLDMWIRSDGSKQYASDKYQDIVECNTYTSYKETCEKCGLSTIFDTEALELIAYQTSYYFENGSLDPEYIPDDVPSVSSSDNITNNDNSIPDSSNIRNSKTFLSGKTAKTDSALSFFLDSSDDMIDYNRMAIRAVLAIIILAIIFYRKKRKKK